MAVDAVGHVDIAMAKPLAQVRDRDAAVQAGAGIAEAQLGGWKPSCRPAALAALPNASRYPWGAWCPRRRPGTGSPPRARPCGPRWPARRVPAAGHRGTRQACGA